MPDHWDERAERAVLCAVMLQPSCLARADLSAADMFDPRHRLIFEAMRTLALSKKPCDSITVADALGDNLRAVGGLSALAAILRESATADNVEYYAEIVRRKSLERAIRATASAVLSSNLEGDELLAAYQQSLARVSRRLPDRSTTMADLARETFREIQQRVEGEKQRRVISTGIAALDETLGGGLEPGTTTVVGGWTSEGKSSLLRTIANNVAATGAAVDYYSLEAASSALGRRALSHHADIELNRVRTLDVNHKPTRLEMTQLIEAVDRLDFPRWRITNRAGLSSADIALLVRRAREEINTGIVIVDYLQKLKERGQSRREQVGVGINGLAALALNEDLPVLTASQFSRKPKDSPNRAPTLQDLRESGDIEQDSDNVLLIYHHNDWHGVIVAKQRDGITGGVRLHWDKRHTTWADFRGQE